MAAFHAFVEDCRGRLRPAAWAYLAFAVFQAWALARYPADFEWQTWPGVAYLVFLASTLAVAVSALPLNRPTGRRARLA